LVILLLAGISEDVLDGFDSAIDLVVKKFGYDGVKDLQ